MQVAQGQGPVRVCALVQAAIGCRILLLLYSAQDGCLDPVQLALVVFFLPSISTKTSLALAVGIICNLRWWFSLLPTSALTKVHT